MTTRVVFFDLFETLITEGEVSPPAGIPEDVYRRVRTESRHAAMTGRMSYADILRAAGADESTVEASDARRTTEKRAFLMNVEPRILDCLRQIRDGGMRISVISNCSADETAAWPESPLSTLVDDAVFSHEVGLMKPDRAIYLLACRRLGVSPHRSAFVGDGGSDELRGASEVGMRAYQAGWFRTRATEFAVLKEPRELVAMLEARQRDVRTP
jgi:HAD superfamily hydrolase (TIGR01509 family)